MFPYKINSNDNSPIGDFLTPSACIIPVDVGGVIPIRCFGKAEGTGDVGGAQCVTCAFCCLHGGCSLVQSNTLGGENRITGGLVPH